MLTITHVSTAGAHILGPGARELHEDLAGRPPIYCSMTRSQCTIPSRVADLAEGSDVDGGLVA